MYKELRPHIFLLLGALIYGGNFSIARFAMPDYVKPFGFIVLRNLGAMVFFKWWACFSIEDDPNWSGQIGPC